jgi:hypothetical protein
MARRYRAELTSGWAQTRTFDYLADFRNLPAWHPSVDEVRMVSNDPFRRNASFEARARMAGRRIEARIVTIEFERPHLLVAEADNDAAHTTDRFTIEPHEPHEGQNAVRVTYESELRLKAPLSVIGPLMVPALTQAWEGAMAALQRRLTGDGAALDAS